MLDKVNTRMLDGDIDLSIAALGLKTATTTVSISAAAAPTPGQVLTATSGTAATFQTPSGGGGSGILIQTTSLISTATASHSTVGVLTDSGIETVLPANLKDTGSRVRIRVTGILGASNLNGVRVSIASWDGSTRTDLTPSGVNAMIDVLVANGSIDSVGYAFEFVHTPGTTTPLTYRVTYCPTVAGTAFLGRRGNDTNYRAPTVLTLEELD
jgi:hypothetical protein